MIEAPSKEPLKDKEKTYIMPKREYRDSRMSMFMKYRTNCSYFTLAVAKITEIVIGDKFDIVKIRVAWGCDKTHKIMCICEETNARKQVYSLLEGRYTLVYGVMYRNHNVMVAKAFWQTYVPNSYDRKIDMEVNKRKYEKTNERVLKQGEDLLDIIRKENEEYDKVSGNDENEENDTYGTR